MAKRSCGIFALALIGTIPCKITAASTVKLVGRAQKSASLMEPCLEEIHISEDPLLEDMQYMAQQPATSDQSKTGKRRKNRRKYSSGTTFAMALLGAAALLPSVPRAAVYVSL